MTLHHQTAYRLHSIFVALPYQSPREKAQIKKVIDLEHYSVCVVGTLEELHDLKDAFIPQIDTISRLHLSLNVWLYSIGVSLPRDTSMVIPKVNNWYKAIQAELLTSMHEKIHFTNHALPSLWYQATPRLQQCHISAWLLLLPYSASLTSAWLFPKLTHPENHISSSLSQAPLLGNDLTWSYELFQAKVGRKKSFFQAIVYILV